MPDKDQMLAKKGRTAALVIAITAGIWLLANYFGPRYGIPNRYALLVDFAALAAFFWALVVTFQMWRQRQGE